MSDLLPQIEQLSPEKRDLLLKKLRARQGGAPTPAVRPLTPITPLAPDQARPLSFGQERLWFLSQLAEQNMAYNMPVALRLRGKLDVTALAQSFQEILRRHEVLRTFFPARAGAPVQAIAPDIALSIPLRDLRQLRQNAQDAEVEKITFAEAQRPFDLEHGPLLRTTLLQLAEETYILFANFHHIVFDGWSAAIFVRELAALYEAFLAGEPSPLPELPIQYADFAHWQRTSLAGAEFERQLAYWKQQLAGELPVLELPTDRPRPTGLTFQGATEAFHLSAAASHALAALSRQEGVTLFTVLAAAFKILLYRYTGQEDMLIGSAIANRNRVEIEQLIGFFVNTLVLRTDLSANPTVRALLQRVHRMIVAAQMHQDLPFERLVAELRPAREANRHPLFQVMFVLQNAPAETLELPNLTLTILEIHNHTAKFDLLLEMQETAQGLTGKWEYNTALFDRATIGRLSGHFQTVLAGLTAAPDQHIARLPLLPAQERQQMLLAWNNTATPYPREQSIPQVFAAQAAKTPDAVALLFAGRALTYRELNARANHVAHYLRALGVTNATLVGICAERSFELIVGLLGILKAGGVYVPFDSTYPPERLRFMLDDTRAPVLLTQHHLVSRLPASQTRLVCVDAEWDAIALTRPDDPALEIAATDLAYIMYTSGSTGAPKGTSIPHRAVVRLVKNTNFADLSAEEVFLQLAPIAFDASTLEIWGSLLNGARLVIMPPSPPSLADLGAAIRQHQITILWLTAGFFHLMVEQQLADLRPVRQLLAGGDVLGVAQVRKVLRDLPHCRLINGYGPTENTTFTCCYPVTAETDLSVSVPIGRPIANTQVYILDPYLQPTPIGVPGELYIGGDGLARDYFNRPELTREKFVPHPFAPEPDARLYKTGDIVRYLPDGNIQFLGRRDFQVKIRGFRVELGEIETLLARHPAIRATVVLAREDTPGDKRLVAYLISAEPAPTVTELREFLKTQVPDYMMPAAFVLLTEFPLTPNGKVDRQALPAPELDRRHFEQGYVAPRTPTEHVLAKIWAETLKLPQVGIHDNFFELGGDSILSIQIITRTHKAGLQLKPNHLFEYQTIAELAAVADTHLAPLPTGEQGLVTGALPLTPIQQWFFEQHLPEPQHWNQALLLEVSQTLEPDLVEQVVPALLAQHDALRLRFAPQGALPSQEGAGAGQWQQVCAGLDATIPFTRFDFSQLAESAQARAIETAALELQRSFNLAEGPLLRVALFELGAGRTSRLLLVIHHLAVDGVSWRILLEDFQTAYQQLQRGEPVQLPPKTTSFKAWAERLTAYAATTPALSAELAYWLKIPLPGEDRGGSPLPGGARGGSVPDGNTEATAVQVTAMLSVEQTRALLQDVPPAYNTQINDVLVTALAQAFQRWTGEHRLLVDLEGHGREELFAEVDLSRTVGWFTTMFPVLLEITAVHPGEALKSIKEQLRRIPQRGIGYGLLRYLSPDAATRRQLEALPQAAVSFNYLGQVDQVGSALFTALASEPVGPVHSPLGPRRHLIDISSFIAAGQLHIDWVYSANLHQRAVIEQLAQEFLAALQTLIAHCQAPEAGGYTPSDFPDVELSQDKLDQILAEIEEDVG